MRLTGAPIILLRLSCNGGETCDRVLLTQSQKQQKIPLIEVMTSNVIIDSREEQRSDHLVFLPIDWIAAMQNLLENPEKQSVTKRTCMNKKKILIVMFFSQ